MKRIILFGVLALILAPSICGAVGRTYVRGYMRKDGTYVAPHYRTLPDGNFYNNWSTLGNINPYTGKAGTKTKPSPVPIRRVYPSTIDGFHFAPVPMDLKRVDSLPQRRPVLEDVSAEGRAIPGSVESGIRHRAVSTWPDDYSMQAYTLKKQRRGYIQLCEHMETYRDLELPAKIERWALSHAQARWPNDYSMQAYDYDKNLDGYMQLSALISSDEYISLPEKHAAWMLDVACSRWENDFSMQAYSLEKQLDGYYELASLEGQLDEIDARVAEDIRKKARNKWPQDLSMQAYQVRKDLQGYLELRRLSR